MTHRPKRIQITHELGKPQSLLSGPETFDRYGSGSSICLLGLGPDIDATKAAIKSLPLVDTGPLNVFYTECQSFAEQMPPEWQQSIPAHWKRLPADTSNDRQAIANILHHSTILFYRPNTRLFPTFWGPLLAQAQLTHIRGQSASLVHMPDNVQQSQNAIHRVAHACINPDNTVLLPCNSNSLLVRELTGAFTQHGFTIQTMDAGNCHTTLPSVLASGTPAMFFSVNFLGLDMFGERFHMLRAAGVPVAIWLVDTPWHILSGCKAPYWKEADIFVTDASFIEPLKAHGAKRVHHLPLAADPDFPAGTNHSGKEGTVPPNSTDFTDFTDATDFTEGLGDNLVFVGRSEFPDKNKFFSGLRPDPQLLQQAATMLEQGQRPHYHWWAAHMAATSLWPDNTVRHVGCGAEETARRWRLICLEQARRCGVTVYGDNGWKKYIPELTDVRGPVDYYNGLAKVYATAAISLNVTSLMLPAGLTQRHFDVWMAGGLLITDNTEGLNIFPAELTENIVFRKAQDIPDLVTRLRSDATLNRQLRKEWRSYLLAEHTYAHRVRRVLELLEVTAP